MSRNAAEYFVDRHVELGRGERVAIRHSRGEVVYTALAHNVNRAGHFLRTLGVLPEQRVVLHLNDGPEFVYFFLAALKIGAVAVPVNTFCHRELLAYYLDDARAPVLITQYVYREKIEQALRMPIARLPNVGYVEDEGWHSQPELLEAYPVGEDDSAFWLYTSGSTGPQKGVVHRHGGMIACAHHYGRTVLRIDENDRCYSTSKLFFAYGLGNSVIFPFSVGASCVLNDGHNDCETIVSLIKKFRPTLFFSVPALYQKLLACADVGRDLFSSVRMCVSAGEYLPASVSRAWPEQTGAALYDGIGSTEAMHIFCSNREGVFQPGTSGIPVEGYEIKIVDDRGLPVADGETGNLLVRGQTLAKGYWNKHEATQRSFQGEWLATGDMYRRTDDGFYQYVGRQNDVFKSHGLWVSSSEIEQVLLSHEGVLEAAVIALRGASGGFVAKAFVVPKNGLLVNVDEDLRRDLYAHMDGRLSEYKIPESITVLSALPKTATGKTARAELRRMHEHERQDLAV
jgi:benzoate-CoA ligase family protein